MAGKITDLTAVGVSIDRANDVLEIVHANASFSVTPNNLVGITGGSVVSTSDSQTLTNKVISITNTITAKDSTFTIQDDGDATKVAAFQLSGITAGNTRTLTVPDASGTLVLTAATQTLTNKTLTSPTITGGSIDNATVTVDTVSGHTSASIVTIAGLQISSGVIGTNGVATASIADSAVTPAKLQSGTGSGWSYSSWSPTWTNISVGNATQTAKYIQMGKLVSGKIHLLFGTTTSVSGDATFTLPVTAAAIGGGGGANIEPLGIISMFNAGSIINFGAVTLASTTTASVRSFAADTSYVYQFNLSSTSPFTWGTSKEFALSFIYEAA